MARVSIYNLLHQYTWQDIVPWVRYARSYEQDYPEECYATLRDNMPRRSAVGIDCFLPTSTEQHQLFIDKLRWKKTQEGSKNTAWKLILYDKANKAETLARWVVMITESYGVQWCEIWTALRRTHRFFPSACHAYIPPTPELAQLDWRGWRKRKELLKLSETACQYIDWVSECKEFSLLSAPNAKGHRAEDICKTISLYMQGDYSIRGCRHLFVQFCSSKEYGVTCNEITKILQCLQNAAGNKDEIIFKTGTSCYVDRELSVRVMAGMTD